MVDWKEITDKSILFSGILAGVFIVMAVTVYDLVPFHMTIPIIATSIVICVVLVIARRRVWG